MFKKDTWKRIYHFVIVFRPTLIIWGLIVTGATISIYLGVSGKIVSIVVIVVGIFSNAFVGLLSIIGLVPLIGPVVVQILSLPVFWILNGLGYFLSIIAIKKGHGRTVLNYRVLTIVFLTIPFGGLSFMSTHCSLRPVEANPPI